MFQTDLSDIMYQQFLLARNGIPISESNMLADFEREALVDMCIEHEKMELKLMAVSARA